MGNTVGNNGTENSKLPLADRRYKVNAPKGGQMAVQRKSTRKLGSVAVEIKKQNDQQRQLEASCSRGQTNGGDSSADEDKPDCEGGSPSRETSPVGAEGSKRNPSRRRRTETYELVQLTRTENPANTTILLTRTQRVLIENSWRRARKGAAEGGMGARVFQTVLVAQPDMKLLFGLEKVPAGRLKYEGQFRRHAGLLTRALEYIVKNIQYTDKLGQHFQSLGKKHCQMNGGRAFPANYWDTFLECIIQSVLECDGASGGRQHRCREAAVAWRSLISFIVQQMRRGFDDERLLRKRFSASLMGLRGSSNHPLSVAYGIGADNGSRPSTGRPRPSIGQQSHGSGSLGSLEMDSFHQQQKAGLALCSLGGGQPRARASSAVSPLAMSKQQLEKGSDSLLLAYALESEEKLSLPTSGNSPSARSASWCAEVTEDQLRKLNLNELRIGGRPIRSEMNIIGKGGEDERETFYTPRMTRSDLGTKRTDSKDALAPPQQAIHAVRLMLVVANQEEDQSGAPTLPPGILLSRHSFSESGRQGEDGGSSRETGVAKEASHRLLGVASLLAPPTAGEASPGQLRRLSAL